MALDGNGNASMSIAVSPSDISSDADLLVRASVTAPSNEVINKTFTIPYFRSRRYYGIKSPSYFLDVKKKQTFEVMMVSPSGKPVAGAAKVTVTRRDWNCVWEDWGYRGSYHCKEIKQKVVDTILGTARTGQIGDGKIFLTDLDEAIRIRTGETGAESL